MNMKEQLMMQARYDAAGFTAHVVKPDDFSREGVAAMSKGDLCDLLEMHGATPDKRKSQETLAAELAAIMFVEMGE